MATLAEPLPGEARDDRFFLIMALAMAATIAAGFIVQLAAGRSSFNAPLLVHAHALVFFGWVTLFVAQTAFAATGRMTWHRQLGWIGAGWIVAMLVFGFAITITMVRRGQAPFFFAPQHFLVFNPVTLLAFAVLTAAAIHLRRRTDWHRRLHFCGMTLLLAPAFGRLLPMPLLIPHAFEAAFFVPLLFPAAGMVADRRRTGRVHRAWWWGVGAILATFVLIQLVTWSPLGDALYRAVTAGSPGAAVPGTEFPPPPAAPLITGR